MSSFDVIKAALFQGFTSFAHLKHIHARLLRLDLQHNQYLLNMVLKSGFHFNRMTYSAAVFSQALEPNIHLYNTMIRGLASNDCFDQSIEFFCSMHRAGFLPNSFSFPFMLKSCARNMDVDLGTGTHSLAVKEGCANDVFVKIGLVGFYSKLENLEDARRVFDDIHEKSVASWTTMIGGYVGARRFREAVDLFMESLKMGSRPDSYTLVLALSACAQLGDLTAGLWIHNYLVVIGMGRNMFVNTALVDMYAKCGSMERARMLFDDMPEKDMVTWSAVIQGYSANGLPKEALEVFHRMLDRGLSPDRYIIVGVLLACAHMGALQLGEQARAMMHESEFQSNPVVGTALIDMYAKCGKIEAAWGVFTEMRAKDLVVFNVIMAGLAMTGHTPAVLSCFGLLQKRGLKPDENTFLGLLRAYAHAGLVDDGRRLFRSMTCLYSVDPTVEHHGCMVDLLSRAGLLGEAQRAVQSMPMRANAVVWGALLAGCRLHRDTQLAEFVLEQLIELEPWNSGNYVLLSNIYSVNRKWDESEKIRSVMREKGIRKVSAYSWIEVGGAVHEFLVGDTSHPDSSRIYGKLDELAKEVRALGYVPSTEYVLFDIDEEEKEHFLGFHSEKLASHLGSLAHEMGP